MKSTTKLLLNKPEETDVVDIDILNQNMDILDREVTKLAGVGQDGRMSKADKIKLDNIKEGAEKNVVTKVAGKTGDVQLSGEDIPAATIGARGTVQLNNAVDSTLATQAATPSAVKKAYDRAEEAFSAANDGKTRIALAVTAMDVPASPEDTFATLAAKIGQIATGKKFAFGTSPVSSFDKKINVTSLEFRPKLIYVTTAEDIDYSFIRFHNEIIGNNAMGKHSFSANRQGVITNYHTQEPFIITDTGFTCVAALTFSPKNANWFAIE